MRKIPTQRRSKTTVALIKKVAAQVLQNHANGDQCTSFTTNHIAQSAGISIGSLYQYFPNKESILLGLLQDHCQKLFEDLRSAFKLQNHSAEEGTNAVDEFVSRVIKIYINHYAENGNILRQLFSLLGETCRRNCLEEYEKQITIYVEQALVHFFPSIANPHFNSQLLVTCIESTVHQTLDKNADVLSREAFSESLCRMVKLYILNEAGLPTSKYAY